MLDSEILAIVLTLVGGFTGIYYQLLKMERRLTRIEVLINGHKNCN